FALAIILFDCLFQFEWIVVRGRRSYAIEFVLVILCTFWFVRRQTLPRWGMLVVLAAGTVGVSAAGPYRAAVYQDKDYGVNLNYEVPWEEILKVDFIDVFQTYNREDAWEFRNLAYTMHTTDTFDGGLSYWNDFVHVYVPRQVLGSEFKQSLQFDLPGEVTDQDAPWGSTATGMADSF